MIEQNKKVRFNKKYGEDFLKKNKTGKAIEDNKKTVNFILVKILQKMLQLTVILNNFSSFSFLQKSLK